MSLWDRMKTGGRGETSPGDYKRHLETREKLKRWLHNNRHVDPIKLFRACLAEDEFEENSFQKARLIATKHNFSDEFIADEIRPYKYGPDVNPYMAKQLKWDTFWGHEERTRKGVADPDVHKPKTDPTDPDT